jgi:S-adenosylmethionine:tRNA ribosyltransferase-isomerase
MALWRHEGGTPPLRRLPSFNVSIMMRGERLPMKLSDFRYPLPRNLIAKFPASPRDSSRLMVVNRADESIAGMRFSEIGKFFKKGDCLVVNETKVFPARLFGRKEKTNAKIEVFLLRELNKEENIWDVIVDPARKVRIGNKIFFDEGSSGAR